MSGRQYITDKILQVRKDICKYITEEMTIKQALEKLGYIDIGYNSFYQQCKALVDLGYLRELGYLKLGKTHSVKIISVNHDYVYNKHHAIVNKQSKAIDEVKNNMPQIAADPSLPRVIKLTDTTRWHREKKPAGRVFVSGSSLSAVMLSANY